MNRVSGQEERDVVTILDGCLADEKAERGASWVLGAPCDVDEELRDAGTLSQCPAGIKPPEFPLIRDDSRALPHATVDASDRRRHCLDGA